MRLSNSYFSAKKIFVIILLIGSAVNYVFAQPTKIELNLKDIWNSSKFTNKLVKGINSMNDGENYTSLDNTSEGNEINQYSYKTGKLVKNIVKSKDLKITDNNRIFKIDSYEFNNDESKILLATDEESIYRHSTLAYYFIYDIKLKKLSPLSEKGKQRLATFSPNSDKVAFVRENNIYVSNLIENTESAITSDGRINQLINGAADWVYEEEFSFTKAFFWSPNGSKLAYYKFDESEVKEFSMPTYGSLYPVDNKFKYPKAGEKNSNVSIHIYDLKNLSTQKVDIGNESDQYIPRIKWTEDASTLCIERLNRHQNKIDILLCNTNQNHQTLTSRVIYTEESQTYIDGSDEKIFFLKNKKQFIWLSDKDGYTHIYLYDNSGKEISQITKGEWDVTEYIGIDEKTATIYYISAESSPMERELFSIKSDGSNQTKLSERKGQNATNFSVGFKYYINTHSDANSPAYVSLHKSNGKLIRVLENNSALKNLLNTYNLNKKEFFTFTTSEDIVLNAWMIKPVNFSPDKKHPVFMHVYGGPGAQTVNDRWDGSNYLYHQYLAQLGYIVVSIDNRGTGARGRDFKNCTYLQLGKLETQDQIEGAKYLSTLKFVDSKRIGIQGWSYGGYMSSLCITKGADLFKAAIAVAPVTNWRFYDSIYTERYMRTPQENPEGYDQNSPINHVEKLKGKYLLIHGTADDNVHFQNAVEITTALINANKQFDNAYYPDKNHSIYGGITRLHLYTKITQFILENL